MLSSRAQRSIACSRSLAKHSCHQQQQPLQGLFSRVARMHGRLSKGGCPQLLMQVMTDSQCAGPEQPFTSVVRAWCVACTLSDKGWLAFSGDCLCEPLQMDLIQTMEIGFSVPAQLIRKVPKGACKCRAHTWKCCGSNEGDTWQATLRSGGLWDRRARCSAEACACSRYAQAFCSLLITSGLSMTAP